MKEFGEGVRWLCVYIAEAHTVDEWPMPCVNSPCRHVQPTTLEKRVEHAREFLETFRPPFDVLVDTYVDAWQDPFLKFFSAWPERFYVFQPIDDASGWRLGWVNQPSELFGHRVDDIREWLEKNVERHVGAPPLLRRTTSVVLAEEARLAKVRQVFEVYEEKGKGYISRENMRNVLKSVGYMPELFRVVFAELDVDKSGTIDLRELEAFFSSVHPRLQQELLEQAQLRQAGGPVEPQPIAQVAAEVPCA